ncbi:hypothetical protein MKX03_005265 [Papaver bracteatum]|nr:hypothetical protein MKX03_005265 [Papaver bracteatum]
MEDVSNKTTFNGELIETPKDLHFLSNLDTMVAMIDTFHCFNKILDVGRLDAAEVIKDGLAKVLVYYYPLAGRIIMNEKHKFMVNCTGEGVLFVEAEANLALEEIGDFTKPDPVTYGKLVYGLLDPRNILQNPLLVAQLKINKACDLNSISVLPPRSRRPNGITYGSDSSIFGRSQLRSQQHSQGISSQLSQLTSELSQNSIDNIINNEQRFSSQENSAKRISCLAPSSLSREETQMPISRS